MIEWQLLIILPTNLFFNGLKVPREKVHGISIPQIAVMKLSQLNKKLSQNRILKIFNITKIKLIGWHPSILFVGVGKSRRYGSLPWSRWFDSSGKENRTVPRVQFPRLLLSKQLAIEKMKVSYPTEIVNSPACF
jgi:hypothetical protein